MRIRESQILLVVKEGTTLSAQIDISEKTGTLMILRMTMTVHRAYEIFKFPILRRTNIFFFTGHRQTRLVKSVRQDLSQECQEPARVHFSVMEPI